VIIANNDQAMEAAGEKAKELVKDQPDWMENRQYRGQDKSGSNTGNREYFPAYYTPLN